MLDANCLKKLRLDGIRTTEFCGQSYKASTLVNYNSSSRKYKQFTCNYESRVIIYKRKMFIRLATGV